MVWNVGLLFISVMKMLFKNLKSYFSFCLVLKHRVIWFKSILMKFKPVKYVSLSYNLKKIQQYYFNSKYLTELHDIS